MHNIGCVSSSHLMCLTSIGDISWMWHRRVAHINMNHLNKLISKELVKGLPKLKFVKDDLCEACQEGKQSRVSFKAKTMISTSRPVELLHLDFFGLSRTLSIGWNYYALVIMDDYSRFTWALFISLKNNAFTAFCKLA